MPLTIDTRTDEQLQWDGINRRTSSDRRKTEERRQDIRFELNAKNRRTGEGRRGEDDNPWNQPHD